MIIELKNISKSFSSSGEKIILFEKFNAHVDQNEILGIIGPSGSGKSSLLHIFGLLSVPEEGDIIFDKKIYNLKNSKDDSFWSGGRKNIGFIYQFHHLLPEFSAKENLVIPQILCGKKRIEAENYAEKFLRKLNLFHLSKRKPNQMSGGENQRISILRSVIKKPLIILADEPTGSLDEKNSELLFNFLLEIKEESSCSLIISSHNKDLIQKLPRVLNL
jgi:lipoprotein-releasing system ATP-binding protein